MNNHYKRQYRELGDETKEKISLSTTGKPKSEQHKQRISQAMKDYWQQVPHRPQSGITMNDLIEESKPLIKVKKLVILPLCNNNLNLSNYEKC